MAILNDTRKDVSVNFRKVKGTCKSYAQLTRYWCEKNEKQISAVTTPSS